MDRNRRRIALGLGAAIASAVAWWPGRARAGSGGRSGESVSATGTIALQGTPDGKQIPLEAIYWIDYRAAKLFVTAPKVSTTKSSVDLVGEVAVRDLIADFSLPTGVVPRFAMCPASLGALGLGRSVLLVIETATKQLAVYSTEVRAEVIDDKPDFKLVQIRPYARFDPGRANRPVQILCTSATIIIQTGLNKKQVPLDAVYWLESNEEGARLFTAIPDVRVTAGSTRMVGEVAARDLWADFGIKAAGDPPNFLMSTASLGATKMGMSSLFVLETTSNRMGIYQASPKASPTGALPVLDKVGIRAYEPPPLPPGA